MEIIQIIPTDMNGTETNSVNSRDIYKYLEIKKHYSDWIKKAIKKYDFKENEDFTEHRFVIRKATQIDYIVTMDMAKELCMVDASKKGKETRKYFLSVEKQASLPKKAIKEIKLALAGVIELDERVDVHHDRLIELENYVEADIASRPIDHIQQTALLNARHKKVFELAKLYEADKDDKVLIRKLYSKIGSLFKKQFSLPRYDALRKIDFEDGVIFIQNISLKDLA